MRPTVSPAVEMRGIVKRFGPIEANAGVDLTVARGEIHCLLGENGAGKSTLMNILFGMVRPDAGAIRLHGRAVDIAGPSHAIALGIGMVHQHFMLAGWLTVAENVVCGMEPVRYGLLDVKRAREHVAAVSRRYGLAVDPDGLVENLSVGEQQRVEIVKTLMRDAQVLILDEPTAVLTPREADDLFAVLRRLAQEGRAVILITHKLRETMAVADRVTVLRQGRNAGTLRTADTSPAQLAELMVGRSLTQGISPLTQAIFPASEPVAPPAAGPAPLRLDGVSVAGRGGRPLLHTIDLDVKAGEIVGIAGVEGNGQRELEEVVTGLLQPTAGRLLIGGRELGRGGARRFRALGGAHIPSDRLRRGLIPAFSVARNAVLGQHWHPPFARRGVLQHGAVYRHAAALVEAFHLRTDSVATPARALSGGNQQKLVFARELSRDPRVIVAAQPTRGVDVGAVAQLHNVLLQMRAAGKAVLLISAELDELMALCDRIAVLYEGRIVAAGPRARFTEADLGLWMGGGRPGD